MAFAFGAATKVAFAGMNCRKARTQPVMIELTISTEKKEWNAPLHIGGAYPLCLGCS